jgi:hypothetical protein
MPWRSSILYDYYNPEALAEVIPAPAVYFATAASIAMAAAAFPSADEMTSGGLAHDQA